MPKVSWLCLLFDAVEYSVSSLDDYRLLVRLVTNTAVLGDVVAENEPSEGVTLAVRLWLPITGGFHEHVAEKFG